MTKLFRYGIQGIKQIPQIAFVCILGILALYERSHALLPTVIVGSIMCIGIIMLTGYAVEIYERH